LIKINLLPVKRAARKSKSPADEVMLQLGIGLGVALIAVGFCGYRWQVLQDEVAQQTQIKTAKTKELDDLKAKVQEVEDYEKKKRLLEDKNRIIEELRKKQGGPVRLLDYLSQSLDPLKIWLTNVEGDTQVTVTGKALSNDDIVEFIRNLQQSNLFSSVALQESVQAQDENITIYSFKLTMAVKG
jgi:type IV pilus assembly protein PilN